MMPSGWFRKSRYSVRSIGLRYILTLSPGSRKSPRRWPGVMRYMLRGRIIALFAKVRPECGNSNKLNV